MPQTAAAPVIVAHRGLHAEYPENSLEAFAAAWHAGIRWCECDVHASADGEPVVIHDAALERVTMLGGPVRARHWRDLQRAQLRAADGKPTRSRLPHLRDLLNIMPSDRYLLIEIKPADDDALVGRVVELLASGRGMVQSFDARNLQHARQRRRSLPLALLVEDARMLVDAAVGPWQTVNMEQSLANEDAVAHLLRHGKTWGAWTVNEPLAAKRLRAMQPAMIITDRPSLFPAT